MGISRSGTRDQKEPLVPGKSPIGDSKPYMTQATTMERPEDTKPLPPQDNNPNRRPTADSDNEGFGYNEDDFENPSPTQQSLPDHDVETIADSEGRAPRRPSAPHET